MPIVAAYRRPVKPTRRHPIPSGHRFGQGLLPPAGPSCTTILRTYPVAGRPGVFVLLTENESCWWEMADPDEFARYQVRTYSGDRQLSCRPFDLFSHAELWASMLAGTLADDPSVPSTNPIDVAAEEAAQMDRLERGLCC